MIPSGLAVQAARKAITNELASNDEFFFKRVEAGAPVSGTVKALSQYNVGDLPENAAWELIEGPFVVQDSVTAELTTGVYVNVDNPTAPGAVYAKWEGEIVELGSVYQYDPADFVKTVPAIKEWQTSVPGNVS